MSLWACMKSLATAFVIIVSDIWQRLCGKVGVSLIYPWEKCQPFSLQELRDDKLFIYLFVFT